MKINNLYTRLISGLVLMFLGYCYIYFADENIFGIVSALLAAIAGYEFSRALTEKGISVKPLETVLLTVLFSSAFWAFWIGFKVAGLIFCLLILTATLYFHFASSDKSKALWLGLLLVWILSPIALLFWLRFGGCCDSPSDLILFLILIVAFNDTFAYFGGKKFGKRPLAPVISPNKTIEGSLFGLAAGVGGGLIINTFHPLFISGPKFILALAVIILCSQAGDLLESKFKRYCQVKDSGGIIPGHGGLLDRVDSYLAAIPVFAGIIHILDIRL